MTANTDTPKFNAGDDVVWSVLDADPTRRTVAFEVRAIVLAHDIEVQLMIHPGEDREALRENFALEDIDIDHPHFKYGRVYIFDCVQPEDLTLVSRF